MTGLVDTNVLVYRFDPRFPEKQRRATELLRRGIADDTVRLAHQAVVEFVAAVGRPVLDGRPLLEPEVARREAEEFLSQFTVLYPTDAVVRTALRGRLPALVVRRAHVGVRGALRAHGTVLRGLPARAALRLGSRGQSVRGVSRVSPIAC